MHMKTLLIIILFWSITGVTQSENNNHSEFDNIVMNAVKKNNYMPVWHAFLNTTFYVNIIPHNDGEKTKDFEFSVFKTSATKNEPVVSISEKLERLSHSKSVTAVTMRGGKLLQLLKPGVGIVIALPEGGFGIPIKQVQWLRASTQSD